MKINKAYRYEIKPNVKQRILLAKHAGAARFAYNWGLQARIDLYKKEKISTNAIEQHRHLNQLKKTELSWMYELSKCAPQEALRDLDRAFQNFYRGLKQGMKIRFPKFKKKGKHDAFRLTGTIKVASRYIQLPRLGKLRLKENTKVNGKILSATVVRNADRWFVSLSIEEEIETAPIVIGDPIGIDLGLTSFIITSEGIKVAPPKPLNQSIQKLKRLSRQHSRKKLGSRNKKKSGLRLARLHLKISNQRRNFLHQLSTRLAKTKPVIAVEDLDVKSLLIKKGTSRHIADAGWSTFIQMLEYKTKWYGSCLYKAPTYFASTKRCGKCGEIAQDLTLQMREWTCRCGNKHDRDINAAKNLLQLYTESSSGISACGDTSGSGTGNWSTSHVSLKQEVTSGIFVRKL